MSGKRELGSYPQIVIDAWVVHEALNRVGFRGEELFYTTRGTPETGYLISVIVRAQGLEFCADVGLLSKLDPHETEREWTDFAQRLVAREFPEEKLKYIYQRRFLDRGNALSLLTALHRKGFKLSAGPRALLDTLN